MNYHVPVLLDEVIKLLDIKPKGIYMDCTVGFGGHAESIIQNLDSKGLLIGLDLDPYALETAKEKLKDKCNNIAFYNNSYKDFPRILNENNIKEVDGFLFDLGISSYQVDSEHRGFSYRYDSPLNMKFNPNDSDYTAKELINHATEKELSDIIKKYGEERYHRRIAKAIVEKRKKNKIETTFDLKNIIFMAVPYKSPKILSRVFQSIRIAVNDEINTFTKTLTESISFLKIGGRVAVISFHSIEDRIVKHFFKNNTKNSKETVCMKILTKKPIIAQYKEVRENRRSKSAKLRVAERIA